MNGKAHGTLSRPQRFTWESKNAAIMLGLSHIGDLDDLEIFDRALTDTEVRQLYNLKRGVAELRAPKLR